METYNSTDPNEIQLELNELIESSPFILGLDVIEDLTTI